MDDLDFGVVLFVILLVMVLVQDDFEQYKGVYVKVVVCLKWIFIDGEYVLDYLYYKVFCFWFQIKFL